MEATIATVELEEWAEETYQLRKRIKELEAALRGIANSPHCSYENNPGEYGTGVADGHRCAANMARKALP